MSKSLGSVPPPAVAGEQKTPGRVLFKPNQETLDLIGTMTTKVAALDQRNRGFFLAEMKKLYFGQEIATLIKRAKNGPTPKGTGTRVKSDINQQVERSDAGKSLADVRNDIKVYRSKLPKGEKSVNLPQELYQRLNEALNAVKDLKQKLKAESEAPGVTPAVSKPTSNEDVSMEEGNVPSKPKRARQSAK